jgi:ABC-2 type transport system permease protein
VLNYIRAELYRNFNRMYFWIFTGIMAALALTVNILTGSNGVTGVSLSMLLDTILYILVIPIYIAAGFIDMVTAEENKNQTLRNAIAFGTPRYKLVLSKLTVSVTLSLISAFIVLGLFYGSAAALFGIDQATGEVLSMVLPRLATALPLWIGAVSIGTFLAIAINNNTLFGFAYAGVFLLTSKIILLLSYVVSDKFMKLNDYLITTRLTALRTPNLTSEDLWTSALIGLCYTVIFIIITMLYFNKKEVK